jgi:hypothetical protein
MEYKGQLKRFPQEIVKRMLDYQVEQGNRRNVTIFERDKCDCNKGFNWSKTKEDSYFWCEVIIREDFNLFFKKYPKKLTNTYELW